VTKIRIPEDVMKYFQKTGAKGGKARAANHSQDELSEWGKKGGRPKSSELTLAKKSATKKGGK
jgi:general stress protein YciG